MRKRVITSIFSLFTVALTAMSKVSFDFSTARRRTETGHASQPHQGGRRDATWRIAGVSTPISSIAAFLASRLSFSALLTSKTAI